jgi:hypothetical protein
MGDRAETAYDESSDDEDDTDEDQRMQDEQMAPRQRFIGTKKGMKGASRTTLVESMDQRQVAPAEVMREMLKKAMSGNTKAQREMNELMNEMMRCMRGEEQRAR